MKVNLKSIPIHCLTIGRHQQAFSAGMDALGLEFQFVDGVRDDNPLAGCARSHLNFLQTAETPLLLMEEDARPLRWSGKAQCKYYVPDGADAFYPGLSMFGADGRYGSVNYYFENGGIIRVRSMAQSHAIVYLSDAYRQAVVAWLQAFIAGGCVMPDMLMAGRQHEFEVYAPRESMFYQAGRYQSATAIRFTRGANNVRT